MHIRVLLTVLTAYLLNAVPVSAVFFYTYPKVCAECFKSEAVFVGTVVSGRTVLDREGDPEGWWYWVDVQKTFRGTGEKTIDVYTGNDSGRFPLEVGKEYLLFAQKYRDGLYIHHCGNSCLMSEAKEKIREIEQIKNNTSGSIEGHIASRPSWASVAGIRVLARGKENVYTVLTDDNGWFRMTGPPGKYSVQIESPKVSPFDLSYDDPNDFVVPKGGCARLQFITPPE